MIAAVVIPFRPAHDVCQKESHLLHCINVALLSDSSHGHSLSGISELDADVYSCKNFNLMLKKHYHRIIDAEISKDGLVPANYTRD